MQDLSDITALALLTFGCLVAAIVVLRLFKALRARSLRGSLTDFPKNGILVDGSNVMYWGGDPSVDVLIRVIRKLEAEGFVPFVVFDASVGYRLSNKYLHDTGMAHWIELPVKQVFVVSKGQTADEVLLSLSKDSGYRIVTNDRFRDWSVQFKFVKSKGRLIKGSWQEGAVRLSGL